MSKIEVAKKLYAQCRDMDIDETMELVLSAETEEERNFSHCWVISYCKGNSRRL